VRRSSLCCTSHASSAERAGNRAPGAILRAVRGLPPQWSTIPGCPERARIGMTDRALNDRLRQKSRRSGLAVGLSMILTIALFLGAAAMIYALLMPLLQDVIPIAAPRSAPAAVAPAPISRSVDQQAQSAQDHHGGRSCPRPTRRRGAPSARTDADPRTRTDRRRPKRRSSRPTRSTPCKASIFATAPTGRSSRRSRSPRRSDI
jgi:hypothetical protein